MKKLLTTFFALGIFGFSAVDLNAQTPPKSSLQNYVPWSEETVHTFENLLVQQDGRVKPLYTVARFTLLQFSGKSTVSFQTQDGEKHRIHYAAWLLDVLFRGDLAKDCLLYTSPSPRD